MWMRPVEGCTAKVICDAKGDKPLHLCDTFEGLPEPKGDDAKVEKKGSFACGLESIQKYLAGVPNVTYHKGYCPQSIRGVLDDHRFALVHLDVDLYEPTRDSLAFCYPRVAPGGIIVCDFIDMETRANRGVRIGRVADDDLTLVPGHDRLAFPVRDVH